ncbi:hypothetical protein ACFE04_013756 [Oxalis oulophora]
MELKYMFDYSKSASLMNEIAVDFGRSYSSRLSPFKEVVSVNFNLKSCSSSISGRFPKAAYSNNIFLSKKTLDSVDRQNITAETFNRQINGTNECLFPRVLEAVDDHYGGVVVDPQSLPANPNLFASLLTYSLSHWKSKGKKGVWLKIPVELSELVPVAVKRAGFEYHHAERGYVMLTYWIPEGPCMLPSNASHQVGVGGFVISDNNEVLVVQEKHCAPESTGLWKIPTGFIPESEEIFSGVVREVKEETGIDTEFVEVIAFRHAHNLAFEKSDLLFICMLKPISSEIRVDDLEIQAAKWMALAEFVEQPEIREDNMFKKIMDICLARLRKRYCGLSVHKLASKFDGRPSSLYYNHIDDTNSNCFSN